MSDSTRKTSSPLFFVTLVLLGGLIGGTLAPGGVASATSQETAPVVAPPEQVSSATTKLAEAREHASRDDHEGSIALYLEAFDSDPALIPQYAHELGHQYNWNDQPDLAIPWFERRLELVPGNVDARIGYARALAWDNQTYEGWQEYRRVLVGHPRILEARLGEAQTRNWLGRHREAARRYQGILDDHPDNREARFGMAQAWAWAGEMELAMEALDPLRGDPEAEALRESILSSWRPQIVGRANLIDDSDELQILRNELAWESTNAKWQDMRVGLLQSNFWQTNQPYIGGWGLSAGAGFRPGVATQLHAYLSGQQFSSNTPVLDSAPEPVDWFLLGWDAWFTWFLHHQWRLDVSTDRSYVDTPRALGNNVAITSGAGSADWRIRPNLVWGNQLRYSHYSDDNDRLLGSTNLTWSKGSAWRWRVVPSATAFTYSKASDSGYWNPSEFLNLTLNGGVSGDLSRKLTLEAELGTGHEWADEENYGIWNGSLGLRWRMNLRWWLDLRAGGSDSRLSSAGGYTRKWASVELRYKF